MTEGEDHHVRGAEGTGASTPLDPFDDVVIDLTDPVAVSIGGTTGHGPAVLAVVIAEHTEPHLGEVLMAVADQSYSNLRVTVLDATGEADVEDRFGHCCPGAEFVPSDRRGFAAVANWALEHVSAAEFPFLLFVKDDTALAPGAVSYLVEEMFRSNAGIVGPKLVDWHDPGKLLAVGYGADRRGRRIDLIEPDEFDQDQYAAVADVFVIPSGAQLVRTDLFEALGGFDPVMDAENEDLDLCWRAHIAAARVIVVPPASARQARPTPSKALSLHRYRQRARHRLRTLAVTSSRWSFPRAMAGGIGYLLVVALGNLLRGRPGHSRAALGAIGWNLRHLGSLRRRRRRLRAVRQVGDGEIHALQTRVGPSVDSLVERSVRPTARLADAGRALRQSLVDERQRIGSTVAVFLGLILLFLGLGTFGLVGDSPVVAGQNPILTDGGSLIEQWWTGYRTGGLGGPSAAPVTFAVFGVAAIALAWAPSFLHLVLLIGPLVIAPIGIFRLVRPLGGPRAAMVAATLAVANPLTADAMAAARWDTLVLWAGVPFLLHSACRLIELEPWTRVERPLPSLLVRYGFLTAVLAALAPAAVPLAVLTAGSVALFGFVSGRPSRVGRGILGAVAGVVVPAGLHLPFTLTIMGGEGWPWVIGVESPETEVAHVTDILLFSTGRSSTSVLMWGMLAAASLALLFGRHRRFDAALIGWLSAAVAWTAAWLSISLDTRVLPGADVLLTLGGAGLALAIGASVRSVQTDLKRYGYGWRQFATVAAGLGGVGVLLLGFGHSLDGRYDHPEVGYAEITQLLSAEHGTHRILWLGDPRVVPVDLYTSPAGTEFGITDGGGTTIEDRFKPSVDDVVAEVGVLLDVAEAGDTVRLGRLLAPFGIDYVIHQPQLAPAPYDGPSFPIDPSLDLALANQLDLRRQAGTLNLIVFRNEASRGTAVAVDESFDSSASSLIDLLDTDLTVGRSLVPVERSSTRVVFGPDPELSPGDRILVAMPSDRWQPTGGASAVASTVGGVTLVTVEDPSVPFGLTYEPPASWWMLQIGQLILVASAVVVGSRSADRTPAPFDEPEVRLDLTDSDPLRSVSDGDQPVPAGDRR